MARLLVFPTRSVTFPPVVPGVGVAIPATGPGVTLTTAVVGPGMMVAVAAGEGVIVTTVVGSTVGGAAVGAREAVGKGVGQGIGVTIDVGDGRGVGDEVGAGVGAIVGLIVTLMIVGTGRGVVIGSSGKPVGSRDMLCRVRWLMLAPTSTLAMGRTYMIVAIKMMIAKKFSSALFIGLPLQDGPVSDQLII
jgi:hypothetical protein